MADTITMDIEGLAEQIATEVADSCVYRQGTDNYARVWQGAQKGARLALKMVEGVSKIAAGDA